jgi:hypothetical protein
MQIARTVGIKHLLVSELPEKGIYQRGVHPEIFAVGGALPLRLYIYIYNLFDFKQYFIKLMSNITVT